MPYNTGAIKDKSGNVLILWRQQDDGTLYTPYTHFNVGHIAQSARMLTTAETKFPNEAGFVVATENEYDYGIDFTLMQTSHTEIDFFANTSKNTFWGAYYKRANFDSGTQEWFFGLGKVVPQFNQAAPGGTNSMAMRYTALYNDSAITVSAAVVASLGATVTLTQTIGIGTVFTITQI